MVPEGPSVDADRIARQPDRRKQVQGTKLDNRALLNRLNRIDSTEVTHMLRAGLLLFTGVPFFSVLLTSMLHF
jgi:hypothetical protein